jgi:signal transduction histidine kinase
MGAILAVLAGCQALLLLLRLRSCRDRQELAAFLLLLICCTLAGLAPNRSPLAEMLALATLWSAGWYSGLLAPPAHLWRTSLAAGGLALALALVVGLGFQGTLPFTLFSLFAFELCASLPVLKLATGRLRSGPVAPLAWVIALAAEFLALGAATLTRGGLAPELELPLLAGIGLLAASGFRLAQEGYLLERGRQGLARRLEERERQLLAARSSLLQGEASGRIEDGLAGAGLLAAGAAHEFRNVLALIQAAAEFGLEAEEPGSAERALRLVLDHVRQGSRTTADMLERVGGGTAAGRRRLELPGDIADLLRMARSACRRDGIRLDYSERPAVAVLASREEVEQILLDLIRNAADSVRRHRRPGERSIRIGFFAPEEPGGPAAVEVRDNGQGVDPHLGAQIFQPAVSSTGSAGLGLFIARRLAEGGGGGLQYVPCPPGEGGCFRLLLPAAR